MSILEFCPHGVVKVLRCYECEPRMVPAQERRTQTPANETQVGGNHYKIQPIQPWDFIHANGIGFLAGNAIKYIARYKLKGGVEDLKKAQHYITKLIEEETK